MLTLVDRKIEDYAVAKTEATSELLHELIKETYDKTDLPQMLTGPIEGRFLKMMVQVTGARRILEVGTFTGYSALNLAEGLPSDGELTTLELDPQVIAIAKRYFDRSEHGKKIKIIEGPALESIAKLTGTFDLAFIDADKENYLNYYEAILPRLKSGGVILIDNVLWSGRVLNPTDETDAAIVSLNERVCADDRVNKVLLPIRDGIFFVRKK